MRLLTVVFILVSGAVCAQRIDYNTIILPNSAQGIDMGEKLVRLAWQNNPENEILRRRVQVSAHEIKQAQWRWLDQIRVSGNLNEFTINPSAENAIRAQFFPRYNVSAFLTLANFVQDPNQVKIKKHEKVMAEESVNARKLALRAEVLRLYHTYLADQELLKIQSDNVTNIEGIFNLVETRFKKGEASIEEYNNSADKRNAERMKLINYQTNYQISKINLEELIGVKLENVQ